MSEMTTDELPGDGPTVTPDLVQPPPIPMPLPKTPMRPSSYSNFERTIKDIEQAAYNQGWEDARAKIFKAASEEMAKFDPEINTPWLKRFLHSAMSACGLK